jgi:hypothetical protein
VVLPIPRRANLSVTAEQVFEQRDLHDDTADLVKALEASCGGTGLKSAAAAGNTDSADQFRIYRAPITAVPVFPDTLCNIVPTELLPAVLILFPHRIAHTRQIHFGLFVLPHP